MLGAQGVTWPNQLDDFFRPRDNGAPGGSPPRRESLTWGIHEKDLTRREFAHHETIIGRPIDTHYEEMLTLARLVDPDARVWIDQVSQVKEALDMRPEPL